MVGFLEDLGHVIFIQLHPPILLPLSTSDFLPIPSSGHFFSHCVALRSFKLYVTCNLWSFISLVDSTGICQFIFTPCFSTFLLHKLENPSVRCDQTVLLSTFYKLHCTLRKGIYENMAILTGSMNIVG